MFVEVTRMLLVAGSDPHVLDLECEEWIYTSIASIDHTLLMLTFKSLCEYQNKYRLTSDVIELLF